MSTTNGGGPHADSHDTAPTQRPIHDSNKMRRYQKAQNADTKPRKDWHIKAFKNPPENFYALLAGAQKKSHMAVPKLVVLGILGGIYIGLGGLLAAMVAGGIDPAWAARFPGIVKLLVGLTFPTALIYIVVAGGELFTSNIFYTTLGALTGKISVFKMLIVLVTTYLANYLGCVLVAGFTVYLANIGDSGLSKQWFLSLAHHKLDVGFGTLLLRAIPANFCVNLAVIQASSAEDVLGKIVAAYLPILTFSTIGLEHIIANDFFIHAALFISHDFTYGYWLWPNMIAVTLGNIIGAVFIGVCYWYAYLSQDRFNKDHWLSHCCCCCKFRMDDTSQETWDTYA